MSARSILTNFQKKILIPNTYYHFKDPLIMEYNFQGILFYYTEGAILLQREPL